LVDAADQTVVHQERRGSALILTIDRPDAGNSLSTEVCQAFIDILNDAEGDTSLRAVIITGAGDRFFCTGGDVKKLAQLETKDELRDVMRLARAAFTRFETFPVPVIAAINGYAIGGGIEMLLATDMRIAAPHAQISMSQVRLNIISGWEGYERLVRDIGFNRAMQVATTGERFSAEEALCLGIINAIAEDADVVGAAMTYVAAFDKAGPLALAAAKAVIHKTAKGPAEEAKALAYDRYIDLWFTEDHREAEAAFKEKRQPAFKGK
jgi:methylglutaconyl-CoA hydratase